MKLSSTYLCLICQGSVSARFLVRAVVVGGVLEGLLKLHPGGCSPGASRTVRASQDPPPAVPSPVPSATPPRDPSPDPQEGRVDARQDASPPEDNPGQMISKCSSNHIITGIGFRVSMAIQHVRHVVRSSRVCRTPYPSLPSMFSQSLIGLPAVPPPPPAPAPAPAPP